MSSQGLIDLSKYVSVRLYSSLGSLSSRGEDVPSHLSDSGVSLWVGIVMQAVSIIHYVLSLNINLTVILLILKLNVRSL